MRETTMKRVTVLAVFFVAVALILVSASAMPDAVPAAQSVDWLGQPSIPVGPLP